MLSGKTCMGQFLDKALVVQRSVSVRIEKWWRDEKPHEAMSLPHMDSSFPHSISEETCNSRCQDGQQSRGGCTLFIHEDMLHGISPVRLSTLTAPYLHSHLQHPYEDV